MSWLRESIINNSEFQEECNIDRRNAVLNVVTFWLKRRAYKGGGWSGPRIWLGIIKQKIAPGGVRGCYWSVYDTVIG